MTGLHLAAGFGLGYILDALLENSEQADSKDSHGWTPLSWAAKKHRGAVVELLTLLTSNP